MKNAQLKIEIQKKVKEFEQLSNVVLTHKERTLLEMGIQMGIKLGLDLVAKESKNVDN